MGWKKEVNEVFDMTDEMMKDMDAPSARHLAVTGLAISGYVFASLSYFAYKGTKLAVKAIKNRH